MTRAIKKDRKKRKKKIFDMFRMKDGSIKPGAVACLIGIIAGIIVIQTMNDVDWYHYSIENYENERFDDRFVFGLNKDEGPYISDEYHLSDQRDAVLNFVSTSLEVSLVFLIIFVIVAFLENSRRLPKWIPCFFGMIAALLILIGLVHMAFNLPDSMEHEWAIRPNDGSGPWESFWGEERMIPNEERSWGPTWGWYMNVWTSIMLIAASLFIGGIFPFRRRNKKIRKSRRDRRSKIINWRRWDLKRKFFTEGLILILLGFTLTYYGNNLANNILYYFGFCSYILGIMCLLALVPLKYFKNLEIFIKRKFHMKYKGSEIDSVFLLLIGLVFLLLVLVGTFFPDNRYIRNNMIGIFITGIITILFWQKRIHIKRSSKRIIRFRRLARKNSRIKLCRIGYVIGIILLISGIGLYYYSSEIRNQLEDDIGEWEKSNRYYNWNIGEFEELRSAYIQELQDEVKMYQLIENVGIVFVVMGVVYIPLMIMIKRGKKKGSSNSSK